LAEQTVPALVSDQNVVEVGSAKAFDAFQLIAAVTGDESGPQVALDASVRVEELCAVEACATDQAIVAAPPDEALDAEPDVRTAAKDIVAALAEQRVDPTAAFEEVLAGSAVQGVVAIAAEQLVGSGPPWTKSKPSPAQMTSEPPRPSMVSSPESPRITSAAGVPVISSDASVPTIVASDPLQVRLWAFADPVPTAVMRPVARLRTRLIPPTLIGVVVRRSVVRITVSPWVLSNPRSR
jgi:hypothetical protein